jgi:uracil-DNA glycosylase
LTLLTKVQVIVCLGAFAWAGMCRCLRACGKEAPRLSHFSHGAEVTAGPYVLLGCFHPSQQNTFTGRLTREMLDSVIARAKDRRR